MINIKNAFKIFINSLKFIFLIQVIAIKTTIILFNKMRKTILKRLHFSITFKITTTYAAIFTLLLLLLSTSLLVSFSIYMIKNTEDIMYKNLQIVSSNIKNEADIPRNIITEISSLDNMDITIFDAQKKIIYTTEKNNNSVAFYNNYNMKNVYTLNNKYLLSIPYSVTKNTSNALNFNNETNSTNNNLYLILNDTAQWNSQNIYIQISHNLYKESLSLLILFFILFAINLTFIITITIIGATTSKKLLRPVENMTETVKNITVNALNTRLDVSGSQDELKELAETFNKMLDGLQDSYERQNQFVSDASHELRTPISVIQGYSNLLSRWGKDDKAVLEESIESIKTEAENMKDLIEKLLFLARGDKKTQKIELKDFYINELIEELVKETKLIDTSHEIKNMRNDKLMVNADAKLIKEALRIFVDNSIKYTLEGGTITLNSFSQGNEVIITIEDTGMGISKEDLPNIFNRFYRADKSRTKKTGGTGLGLSIAKWIILSHKGTIDVYSKLNSGTKITLHLPILKL
ncbi:sensor histidine kinase [Clostridium pasteurianum]|uniref:histidine kinase n=1 Tax=Clostridium pasteurianum BC1 TaxID=86416 RepID=R4K6Z5_CLOPA|nr:HAMP domain-containing sensor histidine kinase [Clostridium pasteurianum]AGK96294.1 signal transduction histidine kinase [Clostridium pasteurianum BC1]